MSLSPLHLPFSPSCLHTVLIKAPLARFLSARCQHLLGTLPSDSRPLRLPSIPTDESIFFSLSLDTCFLSDGNALASPTRHSSPNIELTNSNFLLEGGEKELQGSICHSRDGGDAVDLIVQFVSFVTLLISGAIL